MPMEPLPRRRGPQPGADRGKQTGYRLTSRRRFELLVAQAFTGTNSVQEVLDLAVDEFLVSLRVRPGFSEALTAAESEQRRRGKVQELPQAGG